MRHPWKRYVAIGDSITEGYGMDPVEGVEHLPWARRLARTLAETQPELQFHNLGRRNRTAAQIVQTQLAPALALAPDLVSIAAGPNDLLRSDFSREGVQADLEPLYAAFAGTDADVFTFTYMNLPASGVLPPDAAAWLSARMNDLHAAIELLAARHGALVVDLWSDPASANASFWSNDLQHANALGQRYVAERTIAELQRMLTRRLTTVRRPPSSRTMSSST